jgi:AraC-like DNA-binding protein
METDGTSSHLACGRDGDVVARVRASIRARLTSAGSMALASVARAVGLSSRTMQRRLRERGTCFAELLRCEREAAIASQTLEPMSRHDLASALGYRSTRSLDRLRSASRQSAPAVRPPAG